MRIWKNSPKDSILVGITVLQLVAMITAAATWDSAPAAVKIVGGALLTMLMAFNIIVVSHLFTHAPWFADRRLNAVISVANSINAGQSVQAYQLTHVRNHHRFTNDQQGADGTTLDLSSTYRGGKDGEHEPLLPYAVGGALQSLYKRLLEVLAVTRLWKVGANETTLLALATRREPRRSHELGQVQIDRVAHCLSLAVFLAISWQWTLLCYLPAFFAALTLVNVQNYYRHFGADPNDRAADSVSHYGRFYNLISFNDGYHQEHHLAPGTHWSKLPDVRERHRPALDNRPRIISPVPAMLGFLDRERPLLHRGSGMEETS